MTNIRLSEQQNQIVQHGDGALVVLASAGSGKTRVITERVRYLLSQKPGVFKILALTFTNKAAEEMQLRLKNVPEVKDRTFIGTIHKFCLEIIKSKGSSIGINEMPHIFERDNDRLQIIIEAFENNPTLKKYLYDLEEVKRQKYLYDVLNFISHKKKMLFGLTGRIEAEDEDILLLYNEYNSILTSQNAIDFDDVICLAYKIFIERPKVAELYRKMYKYICIDEAQDLNFAQYEFIKILCSQENKNILMVGDPNQAIYGFNGSDKSFMSETFVKDFNATKIILSENYRSSKLVLEAANKLVPNSVNSTNAAIIGEFEINEFKNELEEAEWITSKISNFLRNKKHPDIEGEITFENIAVLARNKYVFQSLEKQLEKQNISYVFKKTSDLSEYESDIIKLFELGIRILINPVDRLHYLQLINLIGISQFENTEQSKGYDKLNSILPIIQSNEVKDDFKILLSAWKMIETNINSFLSALSLIEKYIETDKKFENIIEQKALALQDIIEFKETWRQYSLETQSENKTLSGFRNQIALGIVNNKTRNNSGITLGTVHSVKGLEFEIVFVMGLNEGTFPDYRAVKSGAAALNEEKNNAFVALTRSKRLLYLTYPKEKFMPWDKEKPIVQRPSRYINELK